MFLMTVKKLLIRILFILLFCVLKKFILFKKNLKNKSEDVRLLFEIILHLFVFTWKYVTVKSCQVVFSCKVFTFVFVCVCIESWYFPLKYVDLFSNICLSVYLDIKCILGMLVFWIFLHLFLVSRLKVFFLSYWTRFMFNL